MNHYLRDARPHSSPQGFSLVELSIVLVILGLLVGGVLSGQSLIHAAELRSVTQQQSQFVTATQGFRDKYFAYPGDMPNATQFWGVLNPTPSACKTNSATGLPTCDGDGNGLIDSSAGSSEDRRFWQHLSNAQFISGSFTGSYGVSRSQSGPGKDGPAGKLGTSAWQMKYPGTLGVVSSGTNLFYGNYGNSLVLVIDKVGTISMPIVLPTDLWNIDTKVDDGKPATGRLVASTDAAKTLDACTTTADPTDLTAAYLLSSTTPDCGIEFRQQF